MSKTHSARRLRIPVRFVDGVWECSFGGAVPVENNTDAELIVPRTFISDTAFLDTMERKESHKVLDEGTSLLVCLTMKPESPPPDALRPLLTPYRSFPETIATSYLDRWSPSTLAFVEVKLGSPDNKQARLFGTDRGGLWLMTVGADAVGLSSTSILLPPTISEKPVASLNHAYTKLSETFETWRISHTGNIYTRVLYQERNRTWYPLDVLRNKALQKQEQATARDIWNDFMTKMSLQRTGKREREV